MPAPPTPPAPADWTRTVKNLLDEMRQGLRKSVGSPETEWAIDYERSLLPPGIRFPGKGDVYVTNAPVPVTLHISWRSPPTTDVMYTLPAGCRVRVASESADRPITVYAVPVEYEAIEKVALSWWTRIRPDYGGYYMALNTSELIRSFSLTLIED
jgi:hypothetical protein